MKNYIIKICNDKERSNEFLMEIMNKLNIPEDSHKLGKVNNIQTKLNQDPRSQQVSIISDSIDIEPKDLKPVELSFRNQYEQLDSPFLDPGSPIEPFNSDNPNILKNMAIDTTEYEKNQTASFQFLDDIAPQTSESEMKIEPKITKPKSIAKIACNSPLKKYSNQKSSRTPSGRNGLVNYKMVSIPISKNNTKYIKNSKIKGEFMRNSEKELDISESLIVPNSFISKSSRNNKGANQGNPMTYSNSKLISYESSGMPCFGKKYFTKMTETNCKVVSKDTRNQRRKLLQTPKTIDKPPNIDRNYIINANNANVKCMPDSNLIKKKVYLKNINELENNKSLTKVESAKSIIRLARINQGVQEKSNHLRISFEMKREAEINQLLDKNIKDRKSVV